MDTHTQNTKKAGVTRKPSPFGPDRQDVSQSPSSPSSRTESAQPSSTSSSVWEDHRMQQQHIDSTIEQLERFYHAVTGAKAPEHTDKPYAAIPPERDPEEHVSEQLDRLLQVMQGAAQQHTTSTWNPSVSMWETKEEVLMAVDLPGISQENVHVFLEQNVLTVTGNRLPPKTNIGRGLAMRHQESPVGAFSRQIPLPTTLEPDALHAQLRNGVLEIRFKRPAAEGKRITVR